MDATSAPSPSDKSQISAMEAGTKAICSDEMKGVPLEEDTIAICSDDATDISSKPNCSYPDLQEELIGSTQKKLESTKRILYFLSAVAFAMMLSTCALSFSVAKLLTDNNTIGNVQTSNNPNEDTVVDLIATLVEGHAVHNDGGITQDPYGLAADSGSLFFHHSGDINSDSYQCTIANYLTGATFLGSVQDCQGIYHSAVMSETISFLSSEDKFLRPGQSLASLTMTPLQTWVDPIMADPKFTFYGEKVYLIKGTIGNRGECKLLAFVEKAGETECPYYEIPDCVIPDCVANPPQYKFTNKNENPYYPQP